MSPEKAQELAAREPFLSEKACTITREIVSDPRRALEFLKDAGFLDENGDLAEPYRQSTD
jgi:hypothetical protein